MPVIRKLDMAEVQTLERKSLGLRKAIAVEYDRYLTDFAPGDYGEVNLDAGENRLTVRTRLKAAAARRVPAIALVFQRNRGEAIRFSVTEAPPAAATEPPTSRPPVAEAPAPAPVAEAPAPAKRRGPAKKSAAVPAQAEAPKPRGRRKAAAST